MRALPRDIGIIHFVGIGGIGMSGIAEILHNLGYEVQGSDLADNANVRRLRAIGIKVEIGHRAENLGKAKVVVVSSAVKPDNPEVVAARARLIPVVRRAEMLGELMRLKWAIAVAGTHGKTTTTSMIGALLETAGLDPTVINGGIINAYGTNARLGAGDWMVVEADESDGTFVKLPSTIAVVTNIDPEHLDHYGTVEALHQGFESFVANIPFYGLAVLCIDHPVVQGMISKLGEKRVVTYGMSPQADIRAVEIELGPRRRALRRGDRRPAEEHRAHHQGPEPADVRQPTTCRTRWPWWRWPKEMGLGDEVVRAALGDFKGVKRRFTKTGEAQRRHRDRRLRPPSGRDRRGAEGGAGRHFGQRHRRGAAAPLHAASSICSRNSAPASTTPTPCWWPTSMPPARAPIEGVSRDALVEGLRARGHRNVLPLESPAALAGAIHESGQAGRSGGVPGRGLDHQLGQRAAGRARRSLAAEEAQMMPAKRRQAAPQRLIERLPPVRGRLTENAPLGAADLVPRRRPGRGDVPARRRRGSGAVPGAQAQGREGDGDRRRAPTF